MELNFYLYHEIYTQVAESRSTEGKKKKKKKVMALKLKSEMKVTDVN